MDAPRVTALYRYPVKGMTPAPLDRVRLEPGATMPFDRAYAIENGAGRFDPDNPRHLPKINFVMLMRNERLASLGTSAVTFVLPTVNCTCLPSTEVECSQTDRAGLRWANSSDWPEAVLVLAGRSPVNW